MAEPHIPVNINHFCCRICCEILKNPVTVPCGHNFCMRCIYKHWDQDRRNNCRGSCPECGHWFPSTPQLNVNTTLAELVRNAQRFHNGSEKRKQQQEHPADSQKRHRSSTETGSASCWRHNSSLDVYCCTDGQIICAVCASAEHEGHRIGCVKEERRNKQEELNDMQAKSKQILFKQEKKRQKLEKIFNQIKREATQTEDSCESVVVSVIDSLQRHYLTVREMIRVQKAAAAAQVRTSIQTLEAKMEEMKKRDSELDCLAQTVSDVYFLQEWPPLQSLCQKHHLHPFSEASEDPPPSILLFRSIKTAVEQIGTQLEEFCNREFASVSEAADDKVQQEPAEETKEDDVQEGCEDIVSQSHVSFRVDSTVTEQDVEPTTRAEFLHYACELTLDPTTAHKDLVISEGDKQVKLSPQVCNNSAVQYPERFISRRQLLCREGLQAERCYYEIEVKGEKSEIALAYKGIERKSSKPSSAFGGSVNSWSLDRSRHYSASHNSESVQLTASPTHQRIGVYLKFKEGTLTFYEVSDTMIFLYRFETKFTEPLYPGFWLGEKCCIKICDLRQDEL